MSNDSRGVLNQDELIWGWRARANNRGTSNRENAVSLADGETLTGMRSFEGVTKPAGSKCNPASTGKLVGINLEADAAIGTSTIKVSPITVVLNIAQNTAGFERAKIAVNEGNLEEFADGGPCNFKHDNLVAKRDEKVMESGADGRFVDRSCQVAAKHVVQWAPIVIFFVEESSGSTFERLCHSQSVSHEFELLLQVFDAVLVFGKQFGLSAKRKM